MRFPESKVIEALREKYPAGCRVKLTKMDDVQAPPIGTFGTVCKNERIWPIIAAAVKNPVFCTGAVSGVQKDAGFCR